MIKLGDNPTQQKGSKLNKFITSLDHEGVRGTLLATACDATKAIMMCWNNSFDGQVKWGHMYLVEEFDVDKYPEVVRQVNMIPDGFEGIF